MRTFCYSLSWALVIYHGKNFKVVPTAEYVHLNYQSHNFFYELCLTALCRYYAFLQIEGLRQHCVKEVYRYNFFFNDIYSVHVSVSLLVLITIFQTLSPLYFYGDQRSLMLLLQLFWGHHDSHPYTMANLIEKNCVCSQYSNPTKPSFAYFSLFC